MDTGPLITLAAADCLDYLVYPGVPVYVPDAVLYEATRDSAALGVSQILDRSAIEVIHDGIHLAPDERAILITEDDRVLQRAATTQPATPTQPRLD